MLQENIEHRIWDEISSCVISFLSDNVKVISAPNFSDEREQYFD